MAVPCRYAFTIMSELQRSKSKLLIAIVMAYECSSYRPSVLRHVYLDEAKRKPRHAERQVKHEVRIAFGRTVVIRVGYSQRIRRNLPIDVVSPRYILARALDVGNDGKSPTARVSAMI